MRIIRAIVPLLLVGCASAPLALDERASLAITDIDVFDAVSGQLLPDRTVLVDGVRIAAIAPATGAPVRARRVIDGEGLTLLPGLINAHVHLTQADDPEAVLRDQLQRGVTTVRNLAGDIRPLRELNRRAATEGLPIPTIHYAAVIAGPKHMADPRSVRASSGHAPGTAPWNRAFAPGDDAAAVVADAKSTGATGLKLYASLDAAQLAALTREARAQGLQVWTHSVVFPANARDVVASRPTQLIHAKGLVSGDDEALPDNFDDGIAQYMPQRRFADIDPAAAPYPALFADMKAAGIALEPALVADGDIAMQRGRKLPPPMLAMRDWACRATGEAHRAGVMIGAGTDLDGSGDMLAMELDRLHACGLPRAAALVAATHANAVVLGIDDRVGRIVPGHDADLLLVAGNPLDDLAALQDVRYVVKRGTIVRAPD